MATTQKAASPKKSQGFQGIRAAIWVIVVCLIIAVCIYNFPLRWTKQNVSGDMPSKVYMLCWLRLCWMAEYISEMVLFAQSNILSIASAAGDIMETSAATNNIFFISLSFVCRAYIINHKY